MITPLPDQSGFFIGEVLDKPRQGNIPGVHPAVMWNPFNKVVQDHRDGTIHFELTDVFRADRGLPVPCNPLMADTETREAPVE